MTMTLGAGLGAVLLAAAVLSGFAERIEQTAFGAYVRSLVITPNWAAASRSAMPRLTDLDRLRAELGDSVEAAAGWRISREQAQHGAARVELTVFGAIGDYRREADMPLAAGGLLDQTALASAERLCLLGAQGFAELFPDSAPADAVDRLIQIGGVSCRIVGVFAPAETRTASRYDSGVIASFHAAARYFQPTSPLGPHEASQLTVVLRDRAMVRDATLRADRVLRAAHGAPLSQPAPFTFVDPASPLRLIAQQRNMLAGLLVTVAAISLGAALIGYGATAFGAVEARRRDIALQMACGATRANILAQVCLENLILGLAGAALGLGLAYTVAGLLAEGWGIPARFDVFVLGAAVVAGCVTGLAAGASPALRAAAAPPALAIKSAG